MAVHQILSTIEIIDPEAYNISTAKISCIWSNDTTHMFILTQGLLFTKRTNVLPQNLVKPRSRKIRVYTSPIAIKCDPLIGSGAAEIPVKFQSDTRFLTSRGFEISRDMSVWRLTRQGLEYQGFNFHGFYFSRIPRQKHIGKITYLWNIFVWYMKCTENTRQLYIKYICIYL